MATLTRGPVIPGYSIQRLLAFIAFLFAISVQAAAQAGTPPQGKNTITAVPNRPTFSTTAETVQKGVFEVEYGLEVAAGHQNINGLLKLGLLKNLELRFANNPFERDAGTAAFGDSAVGMKYRFVTERSRLPTISVLYTATLPTAGERLGAPATQHAAGVLVSKNVGRHHMDFNEAIEWRGRSAGGFNRDYFTALAYSYLIATRLGITAEIAGFSRTNDATPPTLTILEAVTYNVSNRLVLDGGCYVAARGSLPRITFFAGITYSVADLYRYLHLALN